MNEPPEHFLAFQTDISSYSLPEKFTFPFYYEPHPLCRIAAQEVQQYLREQKDWEHDFGLYKDCLLYTSPSPRDLSTSRMPSSA